MSIANDNIRPDIQLGMIAEGCHLHIGTVVSIDRPGDYVVIESLFDGVERGCSLLSCGVEVQTPEQIEKKIARFKEGGMNALVEDYEKEMDAWEEAQKEKFNRPFP